MQTKQLNVGLHQSCDLCDRLLVIGIDGWFLNFQTMVFRGYTVGSTLSSRRRFQYKQQTEKSINDAFLLIRLAKLTNTRTDTRTHALTCMPVLPP